jgi:histidinol dehydrogenase
MIRIYEYGRVDMDTLLARRDNAADVRETVAAIIDDVRRNGDRALYAYAEKFDHASLTSLEVTPREMEEALSLTEPAFMAVLDRAAANIRRFHEQQKRSGFILNDRPGVVMGQKILPVERAGIYVPGGKAPLSSTVLMDAIPAVIAGVPEVIMVTAPNREGKIDPAILAAAHVAGVKRIFKIGGAQAIAALAYGTETVPRVDKIVGPGGALAAEAKRQVYGQVSIDMIAGPSEVLIISDEGSDPRHLAADMLAQAEHDVMATAILITDSAALAEKTAAELERQLPALEREPIARSSIEDNGKIVVVPDLDTALDIANAMAPEHLELSIDEPFRWLDRVRHAGSVFLGRHCPEALGDYMAGANHTLPTGGTARFSSPLGVDDFIKKTQFIYYSPEALAAAARDVDAFARKEGLTAHARSAMIRTEGEQ